MDMHPLPPRCLPRRTVLTGACAALLAPALGGCHAPEPALRVGSIVFPGYETLFLARDAGLLDEREVRLIELLANTDTLRALAAKQLEAASLTLDELMTARADGVDLRAVLVFDMSHGADVVLAKAPVTLQTLAGKRVAVEDGAMGAVMLSALLKAAGLAPDQIHKVAMTLDRSEALFGTDAVDVVVTADPWAARLEKKGARRIFDSGDIPGRIVDVLAVRAEVLESRGPALRQLVVGVFAAQHMMRETPQRAAELMARRLQTPADEVMALYRGLQLPDLARNRAMLARGGAIDQTTLELQKLMLEAGLLPPASVLQALADPRFLPP
jgi:NitT/TauT family transport system substrate-binding protein